MEFQSKTSFEDLKQETQKWKETANENITKLQDINQRFADMTESHELLQKSYKQLKLIHRITNEQLLEELELKKLAEQEFQQSQEGLLELTEANQKLYKETAEIRQQLAALMAKETEAVEAKQSS